eukprot:CAMPEP_0171924332 /NCGR_PEP_ID=MMETSP0993-20121228/22875_1 /TAXON_ID=483369 /ORGANISM="non described non described, Strain CCMP2098" /LENGTH=484 /DNA_ID=CAMNT_0012562551 /DNA_START=9 /DNA_END=1459 /DNA_ORIENTATION=+
MSPSVALVLLILVESLTGAKSFTAPRHLHLKSHLLATPNEVACDIDTEASTPQLSDSTDVEKQDSPRKLSRIPDLAGKGLILESHSEYTKRREATVAKYGKNAQKPESPEKYAARKKRNELKSVEFLAKRAKYEAFRSGALPGRTLEDVCVGDVINNAVLSGELNAAKVSRRGSGAKAFFNVDVWRRRASDGLPVRIDVMVRLQREGKDHLQYFNNNKEREQRIFITEVREASNVMVGSFSPKGAFKVGRRDGGLPVDSLPTQLDEAKQVLLEDGAATEHGGALAKGAVIESATVVEMTKSACWVDLRGPSVLTRSSKDGKLRPLRARLGSWDLDPDGQCLASAVTRKESVTQIIRVGDVLKNVVVKAAWPATRRIDIVLGSDSNSGDKDRQRQAVSEEEGGGGGDGSEQGAAAAAAAATGALLSPLEAMQQRQRADARRLQRRRRNTRQLLAEMQALKTAAAAAAATGSRSTSTSAAAAAAAA